MSSNLNVTILNVGHGNSAVIKDGISTIVIDTGGEDVGGRLLDYLKSQGIVEIAALVLSHADEDHIGSAATLLLAPELLVKQVFVNTDSTKRTRSFQFLQAALKTARREKTTAVITSLTMQQSAIFPVQDVKLEILFPPPESTLSGAGGLSLDNTLQNTNSLSAVVRISSKNPTRILLPADCGMEAVLCWQDEVIDPVTDVLVFPHHGGRPGSADTVKFAKTFATMTAPSVVIFSVHSTRFNLPRKDVIAAIRDVMPNTKLVCTQLPEWLESTCSEHPWGLHNGADGIIKRLHVRVELETGEINIIPDLEIN